MSHTAALSPSPIDFTGEHTPSNFFARPARYNSAASNVPPPFFERRRTPHPHNNSSQRSEDMADRSQSQLRPRLEHRASQTVIDLTDEPEDVPAIEAPSVQQRPPQLGRSDAVNLGDIGDFIDLTEDGDVELVITQARRIAAPRAPQPQPQRLRRQDYPVQPLPPFRRAASPSLFMPAGGRVNVQVSVNGQNREQHQQVLDRIGAGAFAMANEIQDANFWGQIARFVVHQPPMPVGLNYAAQMPNLKPDHVAPPAAREGFTRSPTEDDSIICPSCEEELVHDKEAEEPVAKRGGKAPTRKDREEHPFWVVKECGHVCYLSHIQLCY